SAALEPPGMPGAAILIVSRFDDPLPRRLAPGRDDVIASQEWERAAQSALARCYDEAARPADGPVPSSANAVRFDDDSELLACLARDLLAGSAATAWWWRSYLRAQPAGTIDALIDKLLGDARVIPATIARLHRERRASALVAALSAPQARALFVAMAQAYGIPGLIALPPAPLRSTEPATTLTFEADAATPASAVTSPCEPPVPRAGAVAVSPPWHAVVGASAAPEWL